MDDSNTKVSIRRYRGGYLGEVDMPASQQSPARVSATALDTTQAGAIGKAAMLAERIATDPVLASIMPPQVLPAIIAIKGLAGAAQAGAPMLKSFWHKIHGPGKKRLAKVLHKEARRLDAKDGGAVVNSLHPMPEDGGDDAGE